MKSITGLPYRRDPHSKAILYDSKKQRDDAKLEKKLKDHLHEEVKFLADCTNWTVDDYNKQIAALMEEIAMLKSMVKDLTGTTTRRSKAENKG